MTTKLTVNSRNKEADGRGDVSHSCHTSGAADCLPARRQASDHMQGLISSSVVPTVQKTPRLRGAGPTAQGHTAGHGEAGTLSLSPEDSAIQVGERATDLSSMRCCGEFTDI